MWIEQEIAIAAYIQRVEHRDLPVIVFKHASVGREGLRDLLHLNPIEFRDESKVLVELAARLVPWKSLTPSGIYVQLNSVAKEVRDGHAIRTLRMFLCNDTNARVSAYNCRLWIPAAILKHWTASYPAQIGSDDPNRLCFEFTEQTRGVVSPHGKTEITSDYCTQCAINDAGGDHVAGILVPEMMVTAKLWSNNRDYVEEKTLKDISLQS